MLGGGLLLAAYLAQKAHIMQQQSHSPMEDSTTNPQQAGDTPASDSSQVPTTSQAEQDGENNPLKRFQNLVNSPDTPDGHKVVAAVAAASTVTVAAVANWFMKPSKK